MSDEQPQGNGAAQPAQPDLAGYQSVDELAKGYRASGAEAKKWMERSQALEQRLGQLEAQVAANPRPDLTPRRPGYEEQLETLGIPLDALDQYIDKRTNAVVQSTFQPIAQSFQARNSLLGEYPDYNKYEAEVAQFVAQDPDLNQRYQRLFATAPQEAMELAFLKFGEHKRRTTPEPEKTSRGRQVDASIPGSRTGDARGIGTDQRQEDINEAWNHYQKTGDPSRYAKARYKSILRDDFLNQ